MGAYVTSLPNPRPRQDNNILPHPSALTYELGLDIRRLVYERLIHEILSKESDPRERTEKTVIGQLVETPEQAAMPVL